MLFLLPFLFLFLFCLGFLFVYLFVLVLFCLFVLATKVKEKYPQNVHISWSFSVTDLEYRPKIGYFCRLLLGEMKKILRQACFDDCFWLGCVYCSLFLCSQLVWLNGRFRNPHYYYYYYVQNCNPALACDSVSCALTEVIKKNEFKKKNNVIRPAVPYATDWTIIQWSK